jgi:hypothetical protein
MARQTDGQNDRWWKGSRLRSCLRHICSCASSRAESAEAETTDRQPQGDVRNIAVRSASGDKESETGAIVLPFPIHGEALLVRLAELLRDRVGNRCSVREPFLFAISRQPWSRLTIDRMSYVEFAVGRAEFRLAIEVAPNTSITITTFDFDALVEFAVQYVSARLADARALEMAS